MIFRLLILSLVLGLSSCATKASAAASKPVRVELQMPDRKREYFLFAPKSLKENQSDRALVMVLHGGGGTAKFAIREIGKRLFQLAEAEDFYVVIPSAVNKMWDFGAGSVSANLSERVDDRGYFKKVLDDVATRLPIDQRRIFATGISRGGQASYFIACQFPGRIRAIAPVAMPLPTILGSTCRTGPPVGVAVMNGTKDSLVPYDGGKITVGKKQRDEVFSTNQTLELWMNRNGCDPQSSSSSVINPTRDRMHVEKTEWRTCTGAPVILYRIVGGGHTWPSGRQYLPKFMVGRVNKDIDGAEIAWNFFREFQ